MARIRTIKPSFFTSPDIAHLPYTARLTFIGLWTYVDDAGRGQDDARLIKGALWPLDDKHTVRKVEDDLRVLAEGGQIVRYEADGRRWLAVVVWEHQRINRPSKITTPPPPLTCDSLSERGASTEPSPQEGKGREGSEERMSSSSPTTPSAEIEPEKDDDDHRFAEVVDLLALADLERVQTDKPDHHVGDVDRWLATARRRRANIDGDRIRGLLAEPDRTATQVVDALTAQPATGDEQACAAARAMEERTRRRRAGEACSECDDIGIVERDDGAVPCPSCRADDLAALGVEA